VTASLTAQDWITRLALAPHPEGGWYRETYRSREHVPTAALPTRFGGARVFSTAIYYLLRAGERSALHRIKSDEVWHHYAGDAVTLWLLETPGAAREIRLGGDGEPQAVISAGAWYGARVVDGGAYALMGGTVAPGFDFADFELADRAALLAGWPAQRAIIEALT
jgi:predicted cupin superfamily sugar epimerase